MAGKPRVSQQDPTFDHNQDRHPTFDQVMQRISHEADLPTGPVERLEVNCLASGELTYRWWTPRAEEPEGGYLGPA